MSTALMYHEVEQSGRPLAGTAPGYMRYVVPISHFAQQMAWIASAGLTGVSMGHACRGGFRAHDEVVITFDDGCETDLVVSAPLLLERSFGATFYVVSRWIGRPEFLSRAQLRELSAAGFEIGSHSATHAFLSDLGDEALRAELANSMSEIEDAIARPVRHLSCPGGRTSARVADAAREAGYETMATSRVGTNGPHADRFALARCAVLRDTPQHQFEAFCRGDGFAARRVRDRALHAAKALLGNRLYTSLRDVALRR